MLSTSAAARLLLAARACSRAPMAAAAAQQARSYALDGAKGFSEHEQAVENFYFNKEDEKALKKLLGKVRSQSQNIDPSASATSQAAELASLKAIVGKYKVSDMDLQALLQWKHAHY